MEKGKRLFLLDAYALIYRSYYAFIKNPRINSKGQNTSAIFGFINTLEDILKRENPSHIAIAFDTPGPTFRHKNFKEYKAQREETPEGIKTAIPVIKEIIKAYNITELEVPEYEADDVIGTVAHKLGNENLDVYMVTPDKDYGQLVKDNVFVYHPVYGRNEYEIQGTEEIKNKYNIKEPVQVIDLLGLMGDSADNIPGCPGIGKVSAKNLIEKYETIENILNKEETLENKYKNKICKNKEILLQSKFLATIITDVPLEIKEENLIRKEPDYDKLIKIYEQLEFKSFINKIIKKENNLFSGEKEKPEKKAAKYKSQSLWDTAEKKEDIRENKHEETTKLTDNYTEENKYQNLKELKDIHYSYYLIDSQEKINDFINKISVQEFLCFDTETSDIEPMRAELVGMSFSWKKNEAYYIPFSGTHEEIEKKLQQLKKILENPNIRKIGQNIKYDILILKNYGINIKGDIFDTMVAHYILQPELRHNMDYMAEIYLKYKTVHIEELIGPKGKNQKNMKDLNPEDVYKYACEDADITLQLKEILEKEIKEKHLEELCCEIEMPLIHVLAEMEFNGVSIDKEALKNLSVKLTKELKKTETEIQNIAGEEFNVNSPKQTGEILFEKLKIIEKPKKTKSGQYSTSEEVLISLKDKHPVIEKILYQRSLKKLLSTYIDSLPLLINKKTGKIHTSFNQAVTSTGRLSSSNPNLQNIPIREEMGREIRRVFTAEKGETFLSADYSQIELRLMAHLSEDDAMIESFLKGEDVHADTASKIYKIPIEDITKDMRRKAKTANFGIIYGISVYGLSQRMNVPRKEAKELIDNYNETFPKIKEYINTAIEKAKERGWAETLFHRKRFLPDINSHNSIVRGYAERNAVNAPIQGTAADIIKIAMVRIQKEIENNNLKSKMILQVHDELNFIVPNEELEIMTDLVRKNMENVVKLKVPLIADVEHGPNWLEAHS